MDYLQKWSAHLDEIAEDASDWLIFQERPSIQKISTAYKKFCNKNADELDNLFGEVAELNVTLDKLIGTSFDERDAKERWSILLKNQNFVLIKKLVTILFSFFPSNAYCESVFSIVKNLKTDERNRMGPKLLNSLISVKCNAELNCNQAYDLFLSNPELLKQVKSQEKYEK